MYSDTVKSLAILSPEASKKVVEKVLALEHYWACPNNDYFYTIGAFSAREFFDQNGPVSPDRHDVYDRYHGNRTRLNPILLENFKDIRNVEEFNRSCVKIEMYILGFIH